MTVYLSFKPLLEGKDLLPLNAPKHKLCSGRWVLSACQVSANSIKRLQWKSQTFLSQSEARWSTWFFRSTRNKIVKEVEILPPIRFRQVPFSGFWEEVENASVNQKLVGHLVFPIGSKNRNVVEDVTFFLHVKCQQAYSVQPTQRRSQKVSANQRLGRPSCFSDRPKLGFYFLSNSGKFRSMTSEKKSKMLKDNGRQTTYKQNRALETSLHVQKTINE